MQPGLHAPQRSLRRRRNLFVAQPFDIAQHEDGSVGRRQQAHLRFQPLAPLPPFQPIDRRPLLRAALGIDKLRDRLVWFRAPRLNPVQRGVAHDLQDPSAERALASEAGELVKRPEERVLRHVVRVVATNDPDRNAIGDRLVPAHECFERLDVAGANLLDEFVVGVYDNQLPGTRGHMARTTERVR